MIFRRAEMDDIPMIMDLLLQVNNVHAEGRPDLFVRDARKYTGDELRQILTDDERPIFVAADDHAPAGQILGYAFCVYQSAGGNNLQPIRTLYIDDLCVDEGARGKSVGSFLYHRVLDFARMRGFYNVTLNVWSRNPKAMAFYERMGLTPYKVGMEQIL